MVDLPKDRLTPGPPFSFVGVDDLGTSSHVGAEVANLVTNDGLSSSHASHREQSI